MAFKVYIYAHLYVCICDVRFYWDIERSAQTLTFVLKPKVQPRSARLCS